MTDVTLLDMPDLVMDKILKKLKIAYIMRLRKVCHALRDYIDTKPEYTIRQIKIEVHPSQIHTRLKFHSKTEITLIYQKQGNDCLYRVSNGLPVKYYLLKNKYFMDVFFGDIVDAVKNQNVPLHRLDIYGTYIECLLPFDFEPHVIEVKPNDSETSWTCSILEFIGGLCKSNSSQNPVNSSDFDSDPDAPCPLKPIAAEFYTTFTRILKLRDRPIQIEELIITIINKSDFLNMVPYIDIKNLGRLDISKMNYKNLIYNKVRMYFDELAELDGWEGIRSLNLNSLYMTLPFERFFHMTGVYFPRENVTIEEILYLKEVMLTTPHISYFNFQYWTMEDADRVYSTLGVFWAGIEEKCWYYRVPDTDEVLGLSIDIFHIVSFSRMSASEVPEGVVVMN
ncbi:hypothetical protein GCK72_011207 [Caenorhabditis remanei]|uniref:F-box domain-containing protein n=1 Tax=Caenorhabditis remanei TaxID=31234 RepID=A0A6A5H957_CAERE|nr:hypothetical protein GCK72_011207 [Caenorhabditis remanei]KAF1762942.1 hypothetical protein GCK72_011207 [Caenorhabditis remanei]